MGRKLRIEYGGAIHHVMNRGGHREAIFRDAQDRLFFLMTLADLQDRPKCDERRVALAMQLRRGATMALKWVAQRLNRGTWTNLSNLLSQQRREAATGFTLRPTLSRSEGFSFPPTAVKPQTSK